MVVVLLQRLPQKRDDVFDKGYLASVAFGRPPVIFFGRAWDEDNGNDVPVRDWPRERRDAESREYFALPRSSGPQPAFVELLGWESSYVLRESVLNLSYYKVRSASFEGSERRTSSIVRANSGNSAPFQSRSKSDLSNSSAWPIRFTVGRSCTLKHLRYVSITR